LKISKDEVVRQFPDAIICKDYIPELDAVISN